MERLRVVLLIGPPLENVILPPHQVVIHTLFFVITFYLSTATDLSAQRAQVYFQVSCE
jgi:hypothetical protein